MPNRACIKPDILIIDDSESDTMLMEEAIRHTMMPGSIKILHEGKEAILYLHREPPYDNDPRPDLILLDLNMPGLSGYELLDVVKKTPELAHIPVVVFSGSNDKESVKKAYQAGANCYIIKPENFTKFQRVIAVVNDFWLGIAALPSKD